MSVALAESVTTPETVLPPVGAVIVTVGGSVSATGLVIVKVLALDTPPPGLATVTCAVPANAISPAGIAAVSWLEFTYVVARDVPFQRTTEPVTKLLPLTVSVKRGPPLAAVFGEIEASDGTGAETLLIVKVLAFDTLPSGLATVT